MGSFSIWHLLIILAVVLLLFGGRGKIPNLMKDMGQGITAFKKGLKGDDKPDAATGDKAIEATTRTRLPDKLPAGQGCFMFDLSWSHIGLFIVIALLVLGPKELPNAIRTGAQLLRSRRKLAGEFRSGIDELMREAELDETRRSIKQAVTEGLDKTIEEHVDRPARSKGALENPASKPCGARTLGPGHRRRSTSRGTRRRQPNPNVVINDPPPAPPNSIVPPPPEESAQPAGRACKRRLRHRRQPIAPDDRIPKT